MKRGRQMAKIKQLKKENNNLKKINQQLKKENTDLKILVEKHTKTLPESDLSKSGNSNVLESIEKRFNALEGMLENLESSIRESGHEGIQVKEEFQKILDQLREFITNYVDKLKSSLVGKVDDVKHEVNTLISNKVQIVNQKIKGLSETIDQKFPQNEQQANKKTLEKQADNNTNSSEKRSSEQSTRKGVQEEKGERSNENHEPQKNDNMHNYEKIENENKGLKTFLKVFKEKYPNEFQDVINSMNQSLEKASDQAIKKTVVKEPKVQEGLEL